MNAILGIAAGLACALPGPDEDGEVKAPAARAATSRIAAVTVYRMQARVTRQVDVPDGEGAVELVVGPLPSRFVEGSLFAEAPDGLRVVSARVASRADEAAKGAIRDCESEIRRLEAKDERLRKQAEAQEQDLLYLKRLEGFTGTALSNLTEKGRLDSEAVVALSRFVMESRAAKSGASVDIQEKLKADAEALAAARDRLSKLNPGEGGRREAILKVHRDRPGAGVVRVGYLVAGADWTPRYRLRGGGDGAPVVLEFLASVVQQTGEDWTDASLGLSTVDPSLDASPPELLPLRMSVVDALPVGEGQADDEGSRKILAQLQKPLDLRFARETGLGDVLKYIRSATAGPAFPEGLPIYLDPIGLNEADKTAASPVAIDLSGVPLATSLRLLLGQIGMGYRVRGGVLEITSIESIDADRIPSFDPDGLPLGIAGMGGMGGMGAAVGAELNRAAAGEQAEELRVAEDARPGEGREEPPSATFAIPGRLDVPSRPGPQSLEVARVDLPAEYFAKAAPVLTPRVYRLARLTNAAAFALLPGEADVFVGADFVGRTRLPLVAAGETFVAGFGVDPQLQVARRLVRNSRTVQGGNQVLAYEFRLGLRNYRPHAVKVQLWDRLPRPEGESSAVSLVRTSADLSQDALYQRTARLDNILRWDVDLPAGTVGDKALYVDYEFRLEFARDLPPPRFESGGLKEAPIGGGAMGFGGMGGGMRSTPPGFQ